ncbi:multidrug-resistance like protein 1 isoform i [Anaeramoeba flamelloides]|uniref:Multidrug-resistance like protein 1 isoform i n=1 Tax=Anaeramoeba flamelloides TaxID=1746091 RepID=A0AAV7ZVQ1_9EUKA|nr:multidrug-resistance like protein 1 isoform i [Anaeramoeba flamelloides]
MDLTKFQTHNFEIRNREQKSNFLSRIFFWWVNSIMSIGHKKILEHENLFELRSTDKTKRVSKIFRKNYYSCKENSKSNPFWNTVKASFGKEYMIAGVPKLLSTIFAIVSPIVLLYFLEDFEAMEVRSTKILIYVFLFLFVGIAKTLSENSHYHRVVQAGLNVRSSVIDLIFRKSLIINLQASKEELKVDQGKGKSGEGEGEGDSKPSQEKEKEKKKLLQTKSKQNLGQIVNLMAGDAFLIFTGALYLHSLWSGVVVAVVVLIMLIKLLGWAGLIGYCALVILLPLNSKILNLLLKFFAQTMMKIDARIKVVNELINAIKLVKLYAWEKFFVKKIEKVRKDEIATLKRQHYVRVGFNVFWNALTLVTSIITFVSYVALGNKLTTVKVFTAVAYLNTLKVPLIMMPFALACATQAKVSLGRVSNFLDTPELSKEDQSLQSGRQKEKDLDNDENQKDEPIKIKISHGCYDWNLNKVKTVPNSNENLNANDNISDSDSDSDSDHENVENVENGFTKDNKKKRKQDQNKSQEREKKPSDSIPNEETQSQNYILNDINCNILPNCLTVIIGPVGSGKSSLLSAILGEMPKIGGKIKVNGSVAYCPQESWIINATVRENILIFNEMNKSRYQKVIKSCALEEDLVILPARDLTEIGEKGVNISGGQKARISLARAVYSDNDILLLDDPLSAVDSHVGKHLFEQCIRGDILKNKTIILVTHQLQYLPFADDIIVMNKGQIIERGTLKDFTFRNFDYMSIIGNKDKSVGGATKKNKKLGVVDDKNVNKSRRKGKGKGGRKKAKGKTKSTKDTRPILIPDESDSGRSSIGKSENLGEHEEWASLNSKCEFIDNEIKLIEKNEMKDNKATTQDQSKLVQKEERNVGSVSWKYYNYYIKNAGGYIMFFFIVLSLCISTFGEVATQYWLAIWIDDGIFPNKSTRFYILIFAMLGVVRLLFSFINGMLMALSALKASKNLHSMLINRIIRAPTKFFNTTPTGRILNRFNKDVFDCDVMIFPHLYGILNTVITLVLVIIAICTIIPWFLLPCLVLSILYYKLLQYYRSTSREIKRLDNVSRSPIINNFSTTLNGLAVIRSLRKQKIFQRIQENLIDTNTRALYSEYASNCWIAVRVETIGAFLIFASAFLVWVVGSDSIDPAYAGLVVSYSMMVTNLFNWIIRNFTELEKAMNSIERLEEYSRIENEKPLELPQNKPGDDWPGSGSIEFKNIKMRYREGLEPALRGITAKIKPNEKIGIVGRTGSGKSSLVLCLFRIVELFQGKIKIDGVDISKIGLHDVRKKISIIPQDPLIFSGTVRDNLDPFGEFTKRDEEMWKVLEQVYLKEKIQSLPNKLDQELNQEGQNFSVGEKQLFCLARALVRKSKIFILDEATASVDTETDNKIQKTIRKQFKNCTMITIAHRLNTIMDSDRIMCLSNGKLAEFDTPGNLLKKKDGIFTHLIEKTGEKNALKLKEKIIK